MYWRVSNEIDLLKQTRLLFGLRDLQNILVFHERGRCFVNITNVEIFWYKNTYIVLKCCWFCQKDVNNLVCLQTSAAQLALNLHLIETFQNKHEL